MPNNSTSSPLVETVFAKARSLLLSVGLRITGSVAQLFVVRELADVCIPCAGKLFIYYAIINLGAVFIVGGSDVRALRAAALGSLNRHKTPRNLVSQLQRGFLISFFHGPVVMILLLLSSSYFEIASMSALVLGSTAWVLGLIRMFSGLLKGWGKAHASIIVEFVLPPALLATLLAILRNPKHLHLGYMELLVIALLVSHIISLLISLLVTFRSAQFSLAVTGTRVMQPIVGWRASKAIDILLTSIQSYMRALQSSVLYFATQFNAYLWASVPYLFMPMLNVSSESNIAFGVAHRLVGLVSTIGQAVGIHFSKSFVLEDSNAKSEVGKILRIFSQIIPLLVVAMSYSVWVCKGLGICDREIIEKSIVVFSVLAIPRLIYALIDFPDLRSVLRGKPLFEVLATIIAFTVFIVTLALLYISLKNMAYLSLSISLSIALVLRTMIIQWMDKRYSNVSNFV